MFGLSPVEMLFFGIIALLLFGKKLPEMARGFGKSVSEFKRGINGITGDVNSVMNSSPSSSSKQPKKRPDPVDDDEEKWTAPRFDPPTSAPVGSSDTNGSSV